MVLMAVVVVIMEVGDMHLVPSTPRGCRRLLVMIASDVVPQQCAHCNYLC